MGPERRLPGPRRRFGQHFLHDAGVISRIVAAIDPRPGEHVVEIGPGRGALTRPLLARLGRLKAIEIDRDLAAWLRSEFAASGLEVREEDALRTPWQALAAGGPPLRVAGNLPYNISTPLLFSLIAAGDAIADMTVMLQREVADRIVAEPSSSSYGRLSVAVQYRCDVERLFDVGPGAFTPPPKVASTVIRLVPRPPRLAADDPAFFDELLNRAFTRRRKTLHNALGRCATPEQIRAAGIDPGLRPEALSVDDFVRLANALAVVPDRSSGAAE